MQVHKNKFFRAGVFMELNILSKTQEKETLQRNNLEFFILNIHKTTTWMEI